MKVFSAFKQDSYWNAEDVNALKGIVRGPDSVKDPVLEKAVERAKKEKCSGKAGRWFRTGSNDWQRM